MPLTKNDLKAIKEIVDTSIDNNNVVLLDQVKDMIDFSVDKSERRLEARIDGLDTRLTKKIDKVANDLEDFRQEMHREISDIAETNREFLNKLDNHEKRIGKLELKATI